MTYHRPNNLIELIRTTISGLILGAVCLIGIGGTIGILILIVMK